jgi:hypothetical protein
MSFNDKLVELSQMVVCGQVTHKLDHIATIYINGRYYFNAYRRYNSPYNIVIQDDNNDIYLHQNYTIRDSLMNVLCLPTYLRNSIYTVEATSYKHNGQVPSLSYDIADMRWTDVHTNYVAVIVNFGGIFYEPVTPLPPLIPTTPVNQTIQPTIPPNAPVKVEEADAANILITLSIPKFDNEFKQSESDGPTLSMRFADILRRNSGCYCEMDNDDDDDSDDENNYTILRSGTQIPKPFTH